VTEQLPVVSVQLVPDGNVPAPLEDVKLTVPAGVLFDPLSVSVTVAVQVVLLLILTGLGEQLTVVCVVRVLMLKLLLANVAVFPATVASRV
jgi:hypothetical protein